MGEENLLADNNYILIQSFMVKDLKLKGTELLIYAIIYGFSQNEDNWYTGKLQYLADWTQNSKRNVINILNSLIERGLIRKESEILKNGMTFPKYSANFTRGEKSSLGVKKVQGGGEKSSPMNNEIENTNPLVEDSRIRIRSSIRNINITHTPTTHTPISTAPLGATCQEKPQNDVPQVFEDKDEATFQKFWNAYPDCKRKTNRKACKTALLNVPNLEEELPKILEGLEAWKKDSEWSKEGGQYIPAPLVFIHQRKWEGILKHAEQKKKEDEILKNMFFGDEKIFDDN